jgi:hypothetical protein
MFSVITNIYNKKTKGPTLMELFTATGKLKKFFWLEMFDVCTTVHTAHIHTIFRFVPHTRQRGSLQQWRISMSPCWRVCGKNLNIVSMCAVSPVVHTSNVSSCQKKLFRFSCVCEQFHLGRSFGFLVINDCNRGEHYETPLISSFCSLYLNKTLTLSVPN